MLLLVAAGHLTSHHRLISQDGVIRPVEGANASAELNIPNHGVKRGSCPWTTRN